MPDIANIYQLLAFVAIAGLQVYTKMGVDKMTRQQGHLQAEIEATRVEMFRLASLSDTRVIRGEGDVAGLAATIAAALKVAYLQGKVDGVKGDAPYPGARIDTAAKKLAEHALQGHELTAAGPKL